MTTKEDGGPAFPRGPIGEDCNKPYGHQQGMSLRDYFAGQALEWSGNSEWFSQNPKHFAERAYKMADAMIAARGDTP
jgi:hypothetical protein